MSTLIHKVGLDIPSMSLSGQILSKFAKSSDGRALSIGTQYLKSMWRCSYAHRSQKKQTISHAVSSPISSPATYDEQNFAQSSTPFHLQPRNLGSRGRHNRDDLWRLVRSQCHVRHAAKKGSSRSAIESPPRISLPNLHRTFELNLARRWEIGGATRDEVVPVGENPTGQRCRSLDSWWCHRRVWG